MHAPVRKATKLRLAGPVQSWHFVFLKPYKISFKRRCDFLIVGIGAFNSGNYYNVGHKENTNERGEHTDVAA